MKNQPVEVLQAVEEDLRAAMAFYDSWRYDGGNYFWHQYRDTVSWIEWNPELFPSVIDFSGELSLRTRTSASFMRSNPG